MDKENEKRVNDFLKDYKKLTDKYDVEIGAMPTFVPSGQYGFAVAAQPIPVDRKKIQEELIDDTLKTVKKPILEE